MLLINISNRLANGSTGTVIAIGEKGPIIFFTKEKIQIEVGQHAFTGRYTIMKYVILTKVLSIQCAFSHIMLLKYCSYLIYC